MIWVHCRGCGAWACVDETDGNAGNFDFAKTREATGTFVDAHTRCGLFFELRDSYGRTYVEPPPEAGN